MSGNGERNGYRVLQVLNAIIERPQGAREIAAATSIRHKTVLSCLIELSAAGLIDPVGIGEKVRPGRGRFPLLWAPARRLRR